MKNNILAKFGALAYLILLSLPVIADVLVKRASSDRMHSYREWLVRMFRTEWIFGLTPCEVLGIFVWIGFVILALVLKRKKKRGSSVFSVVFAFIAGFFIFVKGFPRHEMPITGPGNIVSAKPFETYDEYQHRAYCLIHDLCIKCGEKEKGLMDIRESVVACPKCDSRICNMCKQEKPWGDFQTIYKVSEWYASGWRHYGYWEIVCKECLFSFEEESKRFCYEVCDGDMICVVDKNGVQTKIHLDGIDAPELNQPYGKEAADSLAELVLGQYISSKSVVDESGRKCDVVYVKLPHSGWMQVNSYLSSKSVVDESGRKCDVVYVKLPHSGWMQVNSYLVKHGLAWSTSQTYAEVSNSAKDEKRGLWADSEAVSPEQWRKEGHPAAPEAEYGKRRVAIPDKPF